MNLDKNQGLLQLVRKLEEMENHVMRVFNTNHRLNSDSGNPLSHQSLINSKNNSNTIESFFIKMAKLLRGK